MTKRVLVVDDESTIRQIVRRYAEGLGAEVDEAENGRQAVNAASSRQYDLILIDICMPELNGIDATVELRALPGSEADIVAVTGSTDLQPREVLLFDAIIAKPFLLSDLQRVMDSAFDGEPA